jgi:hypothetical protein
MGHSGHSRGGARTLHHAERGITGLPVWVDPNRFVETLAGSRIAILMPETLPERDTSSVAVRIERQRLFAILGGSLQVLIAEPHPSPHEISVTTAFGLFNQMGREFASSHHLRTRQELFDLLLAMTMPRALGAGQNATSCLIGSRAHSASLVPKQSPKNHNLGFSSDQSQPPGRRKPNARVRCRQHPHQGRDRITRSDPDCGERKGGPLLACPVLVDLKKLWESNAHGFLLKRTAELQ